ncbi:MAG: complex I NDUFA9 subunit family protein [Longimicrobiales bacterium]
MTVLLTGAAGFVGNHAVRRLAGTGRPVRALVRNVGKAHQRLADVADKIEIVQADVTDREALAPLMEGVTTLIHLVAIALEKPGQTYETVNDQGTVNVVDAANQAGVERFIFMSQNGADSASPHRFLRSKGRAQDYVARHGRNWTALRPSSIFGPQDEFFNAIARMVRLTPVVFPLIGGGTARFQPVSVYDVTESIVRSLDDHTTFGKALDLGGPEVLTLAEIERRILAALHTHRLLFPAPVSLLRLPVLIMERILPGSPVSSDLLDLLAMPNVVEDNALVTHFGIEPTPFKGEHIAYLENNTVDVALRKIFKGETV